VAAGQRQQGTRAAAQQRLRGPLPTCTIGAGTSWVSDSSLPASAAGGSTIELEGSCLGMTAGRALTDPRALATAAAAAAPEPNSSAHASLCCASCASAVRSGAALLLLLLPAAAAAAALGGSAG
jgi:hypothetical protein